MPQQIYIKDVPGQALYSIHNVDTVGQVRQKLIQRFPFLENHYFQLLSYSRFLSDEMPITGIELSFKMPCLGGKGGFGTVLKTQGKRLAQKKSTNFDSCRDLSGRRLKTVNDAKKLADYIEKEPERQRLEQEKIQKKIQEGLKETIVRKVQAEDKEYEKNHEKALDLIDEAIGAGLKKVSKVSKKPAKKVSVWEQDSDSESST